MDDARTYPHRTLWLAALVACTLVAVLGPARPVRAAASAPAAAATFTPDRYEIRPGDVVSLNVFDQADLSQPQARVFADGTIGVPLIGSVKVAGLTPREASAAVDRALLRYLRHPVSTISVVSLAPFDVLVLGAVRNPNRYELSPESRLTDAIAAAGGLAPIDGDLPDARLETGTAPVSQVSLQRLFRAGDVSLNVPVQSGMTVYVPSPTTFVVHVLGFVDHSGDVTVREGDRLSMALARAGVSSTSNSDLNRVELRRITNGMPQTRTIDMYKVLSSSDVAADVVLEKDDLISVPRSKTGPTAGGAAAAGVFGVLAGLLRL